FTLVEALERRKPTPPDVELFHFLTSGLEPLWVERLSAYRHRCFFVGSDVRTLVHSAQAEYVPMRHSPIRRQASSLSRSTVSGALTSRYCSRAEFRCMWSRQGQGTRSPQSRSTRIVTC